MENNPNDRLKLMVSRAFLILASPDAYCLARHLVLHFELNGGILTDEVHKREMMPDSYDFFFCPGGRTC